jgi:hypothetical protein
MKRTANGHFSGMMYADSTRIFQEIPAVGRSPADVLRAMPDIVGRAPLHTLFGATPDLKNEKHGQSAPMDHRDFFDEHGLPPAQSAKFCRRCAA